MAGHRCSGWSESNVTAGQRRAADKRMDRHVEKNPKCEDADVCVHAGLVFNSAYCCGCGRKIG